MCLPCIARKCDLSILHLFCAIGKCVYMYTVIILQYRIGARYLGPILVSSGVLIDKFLWLLEGKGRKG